jgi:hypothetical protein
MNFIKKWAIRRALKKKSSPNQDLDLLILEELKEAKKNNTMREKLLKLKMVQQIKNDQLEEMRQDVEGTEYEEEVGGGTMEEKLGEMILGKLLGGVAPTPQEAGGSVGPSGILEGLEKKAEAIGMTPEQIAEAKKEIFK